MASTTKSTETNSGFVTIASACLAHIAARNEREKLAVVQVEKKTRHVFVVDPSTSVRLILGDQLLVKKKNVTVCM